MIMEELEAELSTEKDEMMMMMRNWIMTEPELDAAYILIQLSGNSQHSNIDAISSCQEDHYLMLAGDDTDESVGDTTSAAAAAAAAAAVAHHDQHVDRDGLSGLSSSFDPVMKRDQVDVDANALVDGCGEIEAYPLRKKRKFGSILELYAKTKPLVARKSRTTARAEECS